MPTHDQIVASAVEAFYKTEGRDVSNEQPDKDFFSVKQWAAMIGVKSLATLKIKLDAKVAAGLAEKKTYRINGRPIEHYRMKDQ